MTERAERDLSFRGLLGFAYLTPLSQFFTFFVVPARPILWDSLFLKLVVRLILRFNELWRPLSVITC